MEIMIRAMDADSIGICQDIYQRAIDFLDLDNIDMLTDCVIATYADEIAVTGDIPAVEELAVAIDDMFANDLETVCYTLGLSERETDYVMSRYIHNIASMLDVNVQRILDSRGYVHISQDGDIIEPPILGVNPLLKEWVI